MAYVYPNSTVEYFGDLGLSTDYSNCLYFSSTSAKDNAFSNLTRIARETQVSYVSKDGRTFRSALPMSTLIKAGYMRFKNTSFENKWFYAFITSVDYANNGMTQVTFELDVITTWMGDFSLGQCFIERGHTVHDGIGDNIMIENVATGPYVADSQPIGTNAFNTYGAIVHMTSSHGGELVSGVGVVNGLATGIYQQYYTLESLFEPENLPSWTAEPDQHKVVGIQMIPSVLMPPAGGEQSPYPKSVLTPAMHKPQSGDTFDDYVPKNNKMYVYPYCYLEVHNSEGSSATFKYEFFGDTDYCHFELTGVANMHTEFRLEPINYCNEGVHGHEYGISMSHFPEVAWFTDAYQAYMAQTKSQLPITLLSTALTAGLSVAEPVVGASFAMANLETQFANRTQRAVNNASPIAWSNALTDYPYMLETQRRANVQNIGGGVVSAGTNVFNTVAGVVSGGIEAENKANQMNGNPSTDVLVAMRSKDFYFIKRRITKNYAITVDNYFTMFGYAIRQYGVPLMNVRPHFTYVKTSDCVVSGDIPSFDAGVIESIFNNGVRFWNNIANIGNYNLDNSPA